MTCTCDECYKHFQCDYQIYVWGNEHIFYCLECKLGE